MRPLQRDDELPYDGPFGDVGRLTLELQALSEPDVPVGCATGEPPLMLLDRQEVLASEVVALVVELHHKLELYLATNSRLATDEVLRLDAEAAVAWMQETIEDLVATVVGIEEIDPNPPADPVEL
ncbi:hypothetical protein ACX80E_06770 [Arthrobacter sp. TMN-49]